jgi:hypothetical protein
MYTVSITLVSAGPLCGAGEAACGKGFVAAAFPADVSSRPEPRTLDVVTTTASTQ